MYRQDRKLYIGEVLEVDEDDVFVSFSEHRGEITPKSVFKTPKRPDEVWVSIKDVLSIVPQPGKKGSGKSLALALHEDVLEASIAQHEYCLSRN